MKRFAVISETVKRDFVVFLGLSEPQKFEARAFPGSSSGLSFTSGSISSHPKDLKTNQQLKLTLTSDGMSPGSADLWLFNIRAVVGSNPTAADLKNWSLELCNCLYAPKIIGLRKGSPSCSAEGRFNRLRLMTKRNRRIPLERVRELELIIILE